MRCRCGLIQTPEKRGPYLCGSCESEGWTLTPAGYIQVPELARVVEGAPTSAPAKRRKSGKGKNARKGRR